MYSRFFALFLIINLFSACQQGKNIETYKWFYQLAEAGTNSSPHVVDLNHDGIKDIIIGAGGNEHKPTPYAVLAIDGKTGEELWRVTGNDQIVGSAIFQDITQDNIPDVFIGGRKAMLFAIDGQTGEKIWEYNTEDLTDNAQYAYFNFYHPQFVPDQTKDSIPDILITNGGNVYAATNDSIRRKPGVLMIVDAVSGVVVAADTMPDARETYMSPLYYEENNKNYIIFGSGGETFGGSLYRTTLQQLMNNNLEKADVLVSRNDKGHGFIAPPVVADCTGDHIKDIIANWHGGEVIAIDGATKKILWQQSFPNTEANASPIPGYFTGDNTLDFFSSFQQGHWPKNFASIHWMIDGKTGEIGFLDTLGCVGFSSPLSVDLNEDGWDEGILSYNDYNCYSILKDEIITRWVIIDFKTGKIAPLLAEKGKNISSTPWIGDLDANEQLDIIIVVQANYPSILDFNGMGIGRKELTYPMTTQPTWGAYMGNNYTGVY